MDGFVKGRKTFRTTPGVVAPVTLGMDSNIEKVQQLLLQNHHLSL
jgi:hypothetical protein